MVVVVVCHCYMPVPTEAWYFSQKNTVPKINLLVTGWLKKLEEIETPVDGLLSHFMAWRNPPSPPPLPPGKLVIRKPCVNYNVNPTHCKQIVAISSWNPIFIFLILDPKSKIKMVKARLSRLPPFYSAAVHTNIMMASVKPSVFFRNLRSPQKGRFHGIGCIRGTKEIYNVQRANV